MKVKYKKCSCGQISVTEGYEYDVLKIDGTLFIFLDDDGKKRVANLNSRCWEVIENG